MKNSNQDTFKVGFENPSGLELVLPGNVSPQVGVVVTPGCGGLATNAADVRLLPGVHLQQGRC